MISVRLPSLTQVYGLSFLIVAGCSSPISTDELTGRWEAYDYNDGLPFHECFFTSSRAGFVGEYGHPQTTDYLLENGVIHLAEARWTQGFSIPVEHRGNDTLYLGDGVRFVRAEGGKHEAFLKYELPAVPGGVALPERRQSTYRVILHYSLATGSGDPVIYCGNRVLAIEELTLALSAGHSKRTEVLLFAEHTFPLSHLRDLYTELFFQGVRPVWLIASEKGPNDFTFMKDHPSIWWEELKNAHPSMPLPPPPVHTSRKDFLAAKDTKLVDISSLQDTTILDSLEDEFVYLVTVSPELNFSAYLRIKHCLARRHDQNGFRFKLEIGG